MSTALAAAFARHVAGDRAAALPYYEAGLRHEPGDAKAWTSLAELHSQAERHAAAIECARKAVDLAPRDPAAVKNLGMILCRAEEYREAEVWLDQAAAMDPDAWSIALDLALLYYRTGRLDDSEAAFVQALARAPSDEIRSILCTHMAYPVLSRTITQATVGSPDWRRGLMLYRHRFNELARTQAWDLAPEWDGEDLADKHILVHQDQGDGDTLQFCRFLPELGHRAGRLTLAVPRRLIRLLHQLPWPSQVDHSLEILDFEGPLPIPDYHSPICTYFLHLDCTAPWQRVPYLRTPFRIVDLWSHMEPPRSGEISVGLVWAPRPTGENARRRAVPLELLLPLASHHCRHGSSDATARERRCSRHWRKDQLSAALGHLVPPDAIDGLPAAQGRRQHQVQDPRAEDLEIRPVGENQNLGELFICASQVQRSTVDGHAI
jgi:hypothetical protein